MKCPSCGKKLPEGSIECPHCIQDSAFAFEPYPIVPESSAGGGAIALVVAVFVAGAGAIGWAWFTTLTGRLFGWPAILIGVLVGLAVRVSGGPEPRTRGIIGLIGGVVGIGGGILLILYQIAFNWDVLAGAADVSNVAFIFVGLSLARSLAGAKKRPLSEGGLIREIMNQSNKTTK
ncbi:MAG: zinc ribbon domain-containing protein [Candidatus Lernaella stagnicola]|nr:zinc ribbon domain-containing protein [Candidatus Lernaella stagnicola]